MEYLVGKTLEGRYKFVDIIGKGGMSVVYKVFDTKLEKNWAIKQVEKNSTELDKQLEMEAEILKKVDHPALPRIVDVFENNKNILILMDFIDGISLDKKLEAEKFIDESEVILYAKTLCDALAYLHNQSPNPIIYRDLKPSNIMITKSGKLKLIDFGIAREYKEDSTKDTLILGTEAYAAPEQIANHRTDKRTDIYSLGATIYHLATGKSKLEVPYGFIAARLINSSVSEGLEKIIDKCVKENPNERYQKVEEVLYDLENIDRLNKDFIVKKRKKMRKLLPPLISIMLSSGILFAGIFKLNEETDYAYNLSLNEVEAAIRRNDIDKTKELAKETIKIDEDRIEVYKLISDMYLKKGDYEECIDFIEDNIIKKKLRLRKDDEILYRLGLAYFDYKNYKSAYENFLKVDDEKIKTAKFYRELSKYFKDFEEEGSKDNIINSMDEFEDIISSETNPTIKIDSNITLASIYMENTDIFDNGVEKAIDILEKTEIQIKERNNPYIYEKLGQAYKAKAFNNILDKDIYNKYLKKALTSYDRVLKMGYKEPEIYRNIGTINKYIENYKESEKVLLEMTKLYPTNYIGYVELALLYNDLELRKPRKERNFENVIKYYELAESYATGKDETIELQRLQKIVKELEN